MADLQHVEGLSKLQDALKQLPQRIGKNVLSGGVNAMAAVVRDEARRRAPVYTGDVAHGHPPPGTLKRAIILKGIRELSSWSRQVYFVVVRHGKKYQKQGKKGTLSQDAFYWRWVEFGRSKMAAIPFMRPAFETSKQAAIEAFKKYLGNRIPDEVAKLKK